MRRPQWYFISDGNGKYNGDAFDRTAQWLAPEALGRNGKFSTKSDSWAFGILTFQLFAGEVLWYSDSSSNNSTTTATTTSSGSGRTPVNYNKEVYQQGLETELVKKLLARKISPYKTFPRHIQIPDEIRTVLRWCSSYNPAYRPTFHQLVSVLEGLVARYSQHSKATIA